MTTSTTLSAEARARLAERDHATKDELQIGDIIVVHDVVRRRFGPWVVVDLDQRDTVIVRNLEGRRSWVPASAPFTLLERPQSLRNQHSKH